MKSYLFIGGVLDGKRVEIDSAIQQWRVPVPRADGPPINQTEEFEDASIDTHLYVKTWLWPYEVFVFNGDSYTLNKLLIDRYPAAGTINVNLEDLETLLETCEPPFNTEGRDRFDPAMRRLYTAISNHNKQKDTDP